MVATHKPIPIALWAIPVVLLLVATARLPYGFYEFLRLAVCLCSICAAVMEPRQWRGAGRWVLAAIAVLYNPIFVIHLTRHEWRWINWATAGLIALVGLASRRPDSSATA
jgi:hypothetical protein